MKFVTSSPSTIGAGVTDSDLFLKRAEYIFGALDKGVVVLDSDWGIKWSNAAFKKWCQIDPVDSHFFEALQIPVENRPDSLSLKSAIDGSSSCFRVNKPGLIIDVTISAIRDGNDVLELVAICEDVTAAVIRHQKLNALYKAGQELDDLDQDELAQMAYPQRVELLKQNLKRYIHDLLQYNVIEIRLHDPNTGELVPLLEEGMTKEAKNRRLFAKEEDNGVTGFVAATRKSYLCTNTANDPHFIEGSVGARSSMTVPILFKDEAIGTFNVESPSVDAFGPEELQFAELFAREIARALHTLNLLEKQQHCTAVNLIEDIQREIAKSSDDLVAIASHLLQEANGNAEFSQSIRQILQDSRKMKIAIRDISSDVNASASMPKNLQLDGKKILVIDGDERFRRLAHSMLEKKGCIVDATATAASGIEMAKSIEYDAILTAIKHKDMGGTAAYRMLVAAVPNVRVILTRGYEYDCGHTVINVKQDGYWLPILFKPFQEEMVEKALTTTEPIPSGSRC